MDFYYRKSMGNGTIASKFRLNSGPTQAPIIQSNQSNLREQIKLSPLQSATTFKPEIDNVNGNGTHNYTTKSDDIKSGNPITPPNTTIPTVTTAGNVHNLDEKEQSIISGALLTNKRSVVKLDISDEKQSQQPVEFPETHHPNNCNRCYRLKKKCSREYPKCSNCTRTGNDCEYINRSNKRRKRLPGSRNIKHLGEQVEVSIITDSSDKESSPNDIGTVTTQTDNIIKPITLKETKESAKSSVAHKLVSVSSLLVSEEDDSTPHPTKTLTVREPRPKKIPSAALSSSARRDKEVNDIPAEDKLAKRLLTSTKTNLKDEFINLKSISDLDLPSTFVRNYFDNFAHKYPFINKVQFLTSFQTIDFTKESIINLDTYLLMAIGCLIYDSKATHSKSHFNEYFNDKSIISIIDVLDLNITKNDKEESFENLRLLLLLTIYSITSLNTSLCWGLIGILDRLVIQLDLYKKSDNVVYERIFWSVFNLDKELSLLVDKPSQLPIDEFMQLKTPLTESIYENENMDLVNQEIGLSYLKNLILYLNLSNNKTYDLKQVSTDLEKWRISTSSIIHQNFGHSTNMQDFITLINLNYYYMLVELDQLSSSESFQFTLQFISNSFQLIVSESEQDSKKAFTKLSLNSSLFWYKQLFKVIRYSISSLANILQDNSLTTVQINLKLSEFSSNLQVIINLLNYLQDNFGNNDHLISNSSKRFHQKLDLSLNHLRTIHDKLNKFNVMTSNIPHRLEFSKDIGELANQLNTI
ncbi:hypothetical protein DFJ63DRAFT_115328 [Scheffersomyces coipomensis]|uniref:uncharacterized protein n=1 Tax=Scheffersomyces coipomensis TaxID=1788519 RepID=UPI00315D8DD6